MIDRIVRGTIEPGTTLPSEAGLCEYYAVSRTVIREAIKVVEQKGLVRIRQGDGTTVLPKAEWGLLNAAVLRILLELDESHQLRHDVVALRQDLEVGMVARSTPKLTAADFAEMDRLLDIMDESQDVRVVHAADAEIHRLIHRVSGNDVARAVVFQLVEEIQALTSENFGRADYEDSNRTMRLVCEHLKAGEGDAAAAAMAEHISTSWPFAGE